MADYAAEDGYTSIILPEDAWPEDLLRKHGAGRLEHLRQLAGLRGRELDADMERRRQRTRDELRLPLRFP
jgi:hypothetical protein